MEEMPMEFEEKAKIRLEHWLRHNRSHLDEYRRFAGELEAAGKTASSKAVEEMVELTEQALVSLEEALRSLGN
jgi:hypothetical protein